MVNKKKVFSEYDKGFMSLLCVSNLKIYKKKMNSKREHWAKDRNR